MRKGAPLFRALAAALVLSGAACGNAWTEQSMYSYEAPAGDGCAAAAEAAPRLASQFAEEDHADSLSGRVGWSVDEGPFVSAALDDEASLPAEGWTRLRCAYLVTERYEAGFL
ncbi:MAG TPA: hypothetical protein VFS00_19325 [Polyangiaceae bacterium]|nr:hypothetical protein [Polyangiaceae bacterium]